MWALEEYNCNPYPVICYFLDIFYCLLCTGQFPLCCTSENHRRERERVTAMKSPNMLGLICLKFFLSLSSVFIHFFLCHQHVKWFCCSKKKKTDACFNHHPSFSSSFHLPICLLLASGSYPSTEFAGWCQDWSWPTARCMYVCLSMYAMVVRGMSMVGSDTSVLFSGVSQTSSCRTATLGSHLGSDAWASSTPTHTQPPTHTRTHSHSH